jgi:hypothetical protein
VGLVAVVVLLFVVLLAGGVALGLRGQRRLAGGRARAAIDPFTIGEPWRHLITAALRSRQQAARAVAAAPAGPLRDRLRTIEGGLDDALEQCWAIACRGHELRRAITAMDLDGTRSRLDALGGADVATGALPPPVAPDAAPDAAPAPAPTPTADELLAAARSLDEGTPEPASARAAEALQAKLASGARLRDATGEAEAQLRLLGARLDEASARIIELAARPGDVSADLGHLGGDVESLVLELEAVRQGLDAVGDHG